MGRLNLGDVTLCAATSVNVSATLEALSASMEQVDFAKVLLFCDSRPTALPDGVGLIPISRLASGRDYSQFVLQQLGEHIATSHCLVVQWDGFVIDPAQWDPAFLDYDYVGAPWPQFGDVHDVGNGGFSLRSKRLLDACGDPAFRSSHPEDVAIGRVNREWLERDRGIRFPSREVAARFAFERGEPGPAFGFHGVFNMVRVLGLDRFWSLYECLDDRRTVFTDYRLLMRQIRREPRSALRQARLTADLLKDFARRGQA